MLQLKEGRRPSYGELELRSRLRLELRAKA